MLDLENRISGSKITSADVPGEKRDKRCEGCAKTTCGAAEKTAAASLFPFQRFVKDGQVRCKAVPIHSKAVLASCFAMTASAYNGTPAQPQHTQWRQLGEILGGVRFPEQIAKSGFATPPKASGGVVSNTDGIHTKIDLRNHGEHSAIFGMLPVLVESSAGGKAG